MVAPRVVAPRVVRQPAIPSPMDSVLQLADGRRFRGRGFAASGIVVGEVVFNTSMTGYQEILTDPSYCGQIVCLTQPHIGTYGTNAEDNESDAIWAEGLVVRQVSEHYSNRRATAGLGTWMEERSLVGIDELDTRALVRHLRDRGAMPGAIAPAATLPEELERRIADWGSMEGRDLLSRVSSPRPYTVRAEGNRRLRVSAWDFGAKSSIFRQMARAGIEVRVFPHSTPAAELLESGPDGVFLSNGPGDPAAATGAIDNVRGIMGKKPLWGVCLGHQLLALAIGARTYKLPFGHHGGNHPVQELATGRIEITAQNHGFAVDEASAVEAGAVITHVNLNDRSVEGLEIADLRASSVQYHPEAGPGPHDARHLFDRFVRFLECD